MTAAVDRMRAELASPDLDPHIIEAVPLHDGARIGYDFGNGYGAVVIRHSGSLGGDVDRFEAAGVTLDRGMARGRIPWATVEDVHRMLTDLKSLPSDQPAATAKENQQ